jgi:hypothetical protein
MIAVFKSGFVVRQRGDVTEVASYDAKGDRIRNLDIQGTVTEFDKYYGFDMREFILLAYESGSIEVYDVCTFDFIAKLTPSDLKGKFCGVKRAAAV